MSKYKKVKLVTWEEFEVLCGYLHPISKYTNVFRFNGYSWFINDVMKYYFGQIIEVKKSLGNANYTHVDNKYRFLWHELWFKQDDFIKSEEFLL